MSFQQGLSGLNASSKNLDVIGNNVANASTHGTKTSRAEFADMYATALGGGGGTQAGVGVAVARVAQQFSQGSITSTNNPLDMAISGNGFFQVRSVDGSTAYSRNGEFKLDSKGLIVNNQSQQLMGYAADAAGVIQPGQASPLKLPTGGISPNGTSRIDMTLNLDSRAPLTLPSAGAPIDFADAKTYNSATSVNAFDANGKAVSLTFYYQKAAPDKWNVYVTADGTPTAVDGAGAPKPVTSVQFTPSGDKVVTPASSVPLDVPAGPLVNGVQNLAITGIKLDMTNATQFGTQFTVTKLEQNGYTAGDLIGVGVENDGTVQARYSNGQSKAAGQIELANFRNPQGLQPVGGNAWTRSNSSGEPVLGVPGSGNLGMLQASALEESDVDLTGELVNMMIAQRVYQANAQTIKTQDQILQTIVNLR